MHSANNSVTIGSRTVLVMHSKWVCLANAHHVVSVGSSIDCNVECRAIPQFVSTIDSNECTILVLHADPQTSYSFIYNALSHVIYKIYILFWTQIRPFCFFQYYCTCMHWLDIMCIWKTVCCA